MRVLLSTYGSRGDVEPMVGLAVRLQALGAEVRVCAPPDKDFEELLGRAGLPLVPLGRPMRVMERPSSAADSSRRVAEFIAAQSGTLAAAAEGCDALVATGLTHFAARSVTDKLGIPYVYATFCPVNLPSPHHPPLPLPGRPFPLDVTGNQALWDLDAQSRNALWGPAINTHRASIGLPPVDNVLGHMVTGHPWLAADPALSPWQPADLDVVTTGAWILPDERPLPSAALSTTLTPGPARERPPWPARSALTGRRWPRRCCSTWPAGQGRQCPREPRGIAGPGPRQQAERSWSWRPGSPRPPGALPRAP